MKIARLPHYRREGGAARKTLAGWLCCLLCLVMAGDPAMSLRLVVANLLRATDRAPTSSEEDEEGQGAKEAALDRASRRSHRRASQQQGKGKPAFAGRSCLALQSCWVHSHTSPGIGRGQFHAANVPLRC